MVLAPLQWVPWRRQYRSEAPDQQLQRWAVGCHTAGTGHWDACGSQGSGNPRPSWSRELLPRPGADAYSLRSISPQCLLKTSLISAVVCGPTSSPLPGGQSKDHEVMLNLSAAHISFCHSAFPFPGGWQVPSGQAIAGEWLTFLFPQIRSFNLDLLICRYI